MLYPILYSIPVAMSVLFFVAIFFVVVGKRRQYPREAKLALFGLGIIASTRVGQVLLQAMLVRGLQQETLVTVLGITNVVATGLNLLGIGLLTTAVFASRETPIASSDLGRADTFDENPYATPKANSVS